MLSWTCAFLLGVLLPTTWPFLLPLWLLGIFLIAALFMMALIPRGQHRWSKIIAVFLLGIVWCCYRGHSTQLKIPDRYLNKPVALSGYIVSSLEPSLTSVRFEYLIDQINGNPIQSQRAIITEYSYQSPPLLTSAKRGERWELPVRLKKPRGFWNPGSFDYQAWLLQRGIVATGTLVKSKKSKPPVKLDSSKNIFKVMDTASAYIYKLRVKLNAHIRESTPHSKNIGLLQALVTGTRHEISFQQWAVMRSTGVNHLFAVSGLHIGFIGGIVHIMSRFLWGRVSFLYLTVPAQQTAYFGAWLGAMGYSAISGLALPIQRSVIMFSVIVVSLLKRRVLPIWQGWCCAMLLMLLMNPFIVLGESFWLSFGVVAIIFYGLGSRLSLPFNVSYLQKLWIGWGQTQWIVSIGLAPITLWFFQQVSILGFLANLIAIPWVGFIVLPISLLGALCYPIWPKGIGILILIGDKALGWLWKVLSYVATMPLSQYFLAVPSVWILLSTSLAALLFISPKGFPSRYYLGGIALLPLLLYKPPLPQYGEFWVTMLDVGQGLAIVVRTHKHTLIYDTGPSLGTNLDAGEAVVIPYLRTLKINKIDKLIISHGDNDHSGGLKSILQAKDVGLLLTSEVDRLRINNACYCIKGQDWRWDGVHFKLLHPTMFHTLKSNDASCVLKISTDTHQVLLPGDIHKKGEKVLLDNNPDLGAITLLVSPHHGSKTSSSLPFIKRTLPKYVFLSMGYQNRFGFPHSSTVERYKKYQSTLYSTVEEGAITIKLNPLKKEPVIESFYQKNRRFWR